MSTAASVVVCFSVAESGGSRSRQSSTSSKLQMSRESSAGEPKVWAFVYLSIPPHHHLFQFCFTVSLPSFPLFFPFSPLYIQVSSMFFYHPISVQAIYSLKDLQVGSSVRLPRDVNRMKLEVSETS